MSPAPSRQAATMRSIDSGASIGPSARTTTAAAALGDNPASPQRRDAPGPRSHSGQRTTRASVSTSCAPTTTTISSIERVLRTRSSTGASRSRCFGEPNRDAAPAARTTAETIAHIVHAGVTDTSGFSGYARRGEEAGYALDDASPSRCGPLRRSRRHLPGDYVSRDASGARRRAHGFDRAADQCSRDLHLVGGSEQRRRLLEVSDRRQRPGDRRYPGESEPDAVRETGRRYTDDRERPLPALHCFEVHARLRSRHVELENDLPRLECGHVALLIGGQAVEVNERKLAGRGPQTSPKREQRRRRVGRMGGRTALVAEDRVLAVLPGLGVACVAAM